jgi:DNA-binding response OmpR family regulator
MSILVKRIRWKLKELGIEEDIIETTWGKGYRLNQSRFESETTENEYYLLNK